jgi:7-carboxy-7-deazaguanine synthase
MDLRLIEHYVSTQGEGPRVGTLTQFVRFAGCNLKCPLWPCDSQFAIDPKLYRSEQVMLKPWDVAEDIKKVKAQTGAFNICLTGGEPFLQNHEALLTLIRGLKGEPFMWEAFTNGTFEIPEEFFEFGLCPVMDWKLPGSGEDTWVNARSRNLHLMQKYDAGAVKFTIANDTDFGIAMNVWDVLVKDTGVPVFAGPVWQDATEGVVGWGATDVVNRMTEYKVPWKLNVQVHNFIYGAQTRGT